MTDTPDFKLEDDGTVTVRIADKTHRLRRPTIGQLRHLTESQRRLSEASAMVLVKVRAAKDDPPEQAEDEDDQAFFERHAAFSIAEAAKARAIDDEYEAQIVAWSRDAFVRLSDHRDDVPDADDLPGFCLDRTLPARLLNHWRSVPLVPGT